MIPILMFWLLFNLLLIPAQHNLSRCFAEDDTPRACPECGCHESVLAACSPVDGEAWGTFVCYCTGCRRTLGFLHPAEGWHEMYRDAVRREGYMAASLAASVLTGVAGLAIDWAAIGA